MPAFDAYVAYCNKDRRAVQQQVFLEYRSMFGHPFHTFLERLAQQADLQLLVNKPAQHVALWPFFVKNLLKDTSKVTQAIEIPLAAWTAGGLCLAQLADSAAQSGGDGGFAASHCQLCQGGAALARTTTAERESCQDHVGRRRRFGRPRVFV